MGDATEETLEDALVTVSQRLAFHKKRGKFLMDRGEELLIAGSAGKTAIANFLKYDDCASCFYRASISFRASGRYRESGDALVRCAKMYQKLKMFLEAATLYTEAAEIFSKVDKGECVRNMRLAISIYCDAGKFDVAARMERKVATLHFQSKHWEEAAFHFKKAANFLAGEQMLDQSDSCLEFAKVCYQEMQEVDKVRQALEVLALNCTMQNLRRFNGKIFLMDALLTMISKPLHFIYKDVTEVILRPGVKLTNIVTVDDVIKRHSDEKYIEILKKSREYELLDPYFRVSKECLFIDNIIKARLDWKLHDAVDHVYFWNNVRPMGRFQLIYARELITEIETEYARKLELRTLEKLRKDLAQKRREMKATMKAQMKDLGLDPSIMFETLERQSLEDDKFVEDSKTSLTLVWEAHFTQAKKEAKRRAKGESAAAKDELDEEAAEAARLAEEAENEGKEGEDKDEGEGEGGDEGEGSPSPSPQAQKEETEFSDADEESEEESPQKKAEKKKRKKREPDPKKQIL